MAFGERNFVVTSRVVVELREDVNRLVLSGPEDYLSNH